MNSKLVLNATIVLLVFASGNLETVHAQQLPSRETPCQQSAQKTLSETTAAYRSLLDSEKVLVAGEVSQPQFLATQKSFSLTQALAMAGGLTRYADRLIYVFERVSDGELKIKLEINQREVYKGRAEDPKMEKGNVIFVPKRCSAGKTIPFIDAPIKPLVDAPIRWINEASNEYKNR